MNAITPPTPENVADMLTSGDNDYHDGNGWTPSLRATGNIIEIGIEPCTETGFALDEVYFRAVVVEGDQTPIVATGPLPDVLAERARQDAKWGPQNYPDGTARPGDQYVAEVLRNICKANGPGEDNWRDILAEEVGEAFAESDPAALRTELVQAAAVIVAWIEAIDRRPALAVQAVAQTGGAS